MYFFYQAEVAQPAEPGPQLDLASFSSTLLFLFHQQPLLIKTHKSSLKSYGSFAVLWCFSLTLVLIVNHVPPEVAVARMQSDCNCWPRWRWHWNFVATFTSTNCPPRQPWHNNTPCKTYYWRIWESQKLQILYPQINYDSFSAFEIQCNVLSYVYSGNLDGEMFFKHPGIFSSKLASETLVWG